jgi:outer membrane putative beta-barrel porin/alpha-amylase
MAYRFAAALVLAGSWAGCAHAVHPLITEDADTLRAGHVQAELGAERGTDRDGEKRTESTQLGVLLVAGLTGSLDLVLGYPRLRIATTSGEGRTTAEGGGDLSLDFKWRFHREGATSFALKPGFTVPTGDETRGLGTGRSTYGLFLIGSFERAPWTLHTHAGYKANRNRVGEPVNIVHLSAALVYEAGSRVRLVADVARDMDFDLSSDGRRAWIVIGAICRLTRDLDLDLGLRKGLNDAAEDRTFLLGLTAHW